MKQVVRYDSAAINCLYPAAKIQYPIVYAVGITIKLNVKLSTKRT